MIALLALAAAQPAGTMVEGLSDRPLTFTSEDLAAMPKGQVAIDAHGEKVDCTGAWLADLLVKAGAPSGNALRGPTLAGLR